MNNKNNVPYNILLKFKKDAYNQKFAQYNEKIA